MEETILTKIKEEHALIKSRLHAIESSSRDDLKQELYRQLKNEIVGHLAGEEHSIYKHFKEDIQKNTVKELAQMSEYEHHQLKECLQRLNLMRVDNPSWMETFKELIDLIELHCNLTEDYMFLEAKEDFSREELVAFGSEYEEEKRVPSEIYFFR